MSDELNMDSFDEETLDFLESTGSGEDGQNDPPPGDDDNTGGNDDNNDNQGGDDGNGDSSDDNNGNGTPSDDITSGNSNDGNNQDAKRLTLFASALAEEGVLDLEEGAEIKTFDDIANAVQATIRKNELAGLSDLQREYLKSLENGISTEEFNTSKQKITRLESITEDAVKENEDVQRQLITEGYIAKGYSEDKAKKFAQRSFDLGENEADALETLTEQKQAAIDAEKAREDARKQQIEDSEKSRKESLEKIKEIVFDEKSEVIPGFTYNKKVAEEVHRSMTTPAGEINGRPVSRAALLRSKNPIDYEHKLNYLLTLTKDFTDFTAFETKQKSSKAKDFVDQLTSQSSSGGGSAGDGFVNLGDSEDWDWIEKSLDL